MQALIVTCNRDTWQFRLQCQSIGKYLEPCDLHIVINEFRPDTWLEWFYTNCMPHLSNHKVSVYTHADFFDILLFQRIIVNSGWVTQQIFKLAFSYKTDAPYIVLDSKNWFIRPSNLVEIPKRPRTALPPAEFVIFYSKALEKFESVRTLKYRSEVTPFHMDPVIVRKLVDEFGGIDPFVEWFTSIEIPSEFMVYDLFAQLQGLDLDLGTHSNYSKSYWQDEKVLDINQFKRDLLDTNIHLIAIHSALVKTVNTDEIEALLNTL